MPKIGAKVSKPGTFVIKKQSNPPAPVAKKVEPKKAAKAPEKPKADLPKINRKTIIVKDETPKVSIETLKEARKLYDKSKPPVQKPKPKSAPVSSIVEKLANAADREVMRAQDLLRFPAFLARQGIKPEEVSHTTAQLADQLNRERINALLTQWNGAKVL